MRVGLTHGTFDLLHVGHVRMFAQAKSMVDHFVVTLTCDSWVRKGPGRPIYNEIERAEMIAACRYVDVVEIIYEQTGLSAIDKYKPVLYFKAKDYLVADKHGFLEVERERVESHGGKLFLAEHAGWSSSSIIERVRGML